MKIRVFPVVLVLFSLLMTVYAQQRTAPSARGKTKKATASDKQTPVIKSFESSNSKAIIPCPWDSAPIYCPKDGLILKLITEASDSKGDALLYQYSVSGGRILGEGPEVEWDLTGLSEGNYSAKVVVKNSLGGMASKSLDVEVTPCSNCGLPPCITVEVSCPDIVEEGQPIVCKVSISGAEPGRESTYNWEVSAGIITKGQETDTIEIDSNGLGGEQLEVTVEVGGHPPECYNKASGKVQVRKKRR